jgi:hypothetical protein
MKRMIAATLAVLTFTVGVAHATVANLSIIINSPPSTSITCTIPSLTAPVAAGTNICHLVIAPAGWSGALALSGPDMASFALSGLDLNVGATPLNAGTYNITLTATP